MDFYTLLTEVEKAQQAQNDERVLSLYALLLKQIGPETADLPQKNARLKALQESGQIYRRRAQYEKSRHLYEQSYLEAGSSQQAVEALVAIGGVLADTGLYEQALAVQREALQLAESLNYTVGRAKALEGVGGALYFLGRSEESISYLGKAVSLFEQLNRRSDQIGAYNGLGIAYLDWGAIDKAIAVFQQALRLASANDVRETAVTLNNLGESHQLLFDMEQALTYHREALTIAQNAAYRYLEADIHRNLGVELCYLGRMADGLLHLHQALALCDENNDQDVKFQSLYSLAMAQLQLRQPEVAQDYAQTLLHEAQQFKARLHQAKGLHALGLSYQLQENPVQAEQMWQQALFLAHETHQQTLLWEIHAGLGQIANNPMLAKTHYRIAAEVIEQILYPIEDVTLRQKFRNAAPIHFVLQQSSKSP